MLFDVKTFWKFKHNLGVEKKVVFQKLYIYFSQIKCESYCGRLNCRLLSLHWIYCWIYALYIENKGGYIYWRCFLRYFCEGVLIKKKSTISEHPELLKGCRDPTQAMTLSRLCQECPNQKLKIMVAIFKGVKDSKHVKQIIPYEYINIFRHCHWESTPSIVLIIKKPSLIWCTQICHW